jgi:HEAT repeat protein
MKDRRQELRDLLLRLGPQRASRELDIQDLRTLLRDEDPRVRYRAAFALGLASDEVPTKLAAEIFNQIPSEEREHAYQMLINMLNASDGNVRAQAVWALSMMKAHGPAVIHALNQALDDDSEDARTLAAIRLGELGDSRAVEPLCRTVSESMGASSRARAAATLGHLGDSTAVDTLVAALFDDDAEVCWNAIHALGQLGDARAVRELQKVVAEESRHSHGLSLADEADRALRQIRDRERTG